MVSCILPRFYRRLNILSIDVAVGAMVGNWFIASVSGGGYDLFHGLALGLSVWLIYSFDHLFDAQSLHKKASTPRHLFHQVHKKNIAIIWLVILPLALYFILQLPYPMFLWGGAIGMLVGFYFLFITKLKHHAGFWKEVMIAILYVAGISLSTFVQPQIATVPFVWLCTQYFLVALINLLIFSDADKTKDKMDGHNSAALALSEGRLRKLIYLLFCLSTLFIGWAAYRLGLFLESSIMFLMLTALYLIYRNQEWFYRYDRYRWIGDGIFFLPILYWGMSKMCLE